MPRKITKKTTRKKTSTKTKADKKATAKTTSKTIAKKITKTTKSARTVRVKKSTKKQYHLHIVSDSTGSLASHLINAILTQFPEIDFKKIYHTFQDKPEKIDKTISTFKRGHELVLHSLVDSQAKTEIRNACVKLRIPHYDLTGSLVQFISDHTGVLPINELSRLHQVDSGYFQRIEAMEFTAAHDDGRGLESLHEADLVLVGLSRVSKSPTSTYLGSLGYKTANVSITTETGFPTQLKRVKRKIIALTVQPKRLHAIRTARLKEFGVDGQTDYADLRQIIKEVVWAESQYADFGYPILDITGLTIERIAASILKMKKIKRTNFKYV